MLNTWLGAPGWTEREALLRAHPEQGSESGREAMHLVRMLHPEVDALEQLDHILGEIAARSLDGVLTELRAAHDHAELVQRWLETPTWSASWRFPREHPELASDPRTPTLLEAGSGDPMTAQHLGIARLSARMPIAEVYDAVTDRDMAVDTAMDVVEYGDDTIVVRLARDHHSAGVSWSSIVTALGITA